MKYYIRHKFGISTDYNTFDLHPWHGAGQGAANAALRYIALSDTLIDAYHTKVAPQMISDPSNSLTITQSLKAFIDDVVLHATQAHTSYLTLQQQVQSRLQWWNQIVCVTGGALNHKNVVQLPTTGNLTNTASLPYPNWMKLSRFTLEDTHNPQPIETIPLNQGTRYLGLFITGDRNTKPMEQHLWQKAITYTAAFQRMPMS